jgi:hypothetical protein
MAFAQLTYRESLRDIETCLRAPIWHACEAAPLAANAVSPRFRTATG